MTQPTRSTVASATLLLTTLLGILAFDNNFQDSKNIPQLLVITFGLLVFFSIKKKLFIPKRFVLLYACLLIYQGYQIMNSYVWSEGIFIWTKMALTLFLSIAYLNEFKERNHRQISVVLSIISITIWSIACWQFSQIDFSQKITHESTYGVTSLFIHRNVLSEILLLLSVLLLALTYKEKWYWLPLILINLNLVFVLLLSSRTVWLGALLVTICSIFLYLKNKKKLKKRFVWSSTLSILFLTSCFGVYKQYTNNYLSSVISAQALSTASSTASMDKPENFSSLAERLLLWKKSLQLIKEHPVSGAGLNNWNIDVLSLDAKDSRSKDGQLFPQRPHNDFIAVIHDSGIIGFTLYISVFFWLLKMAINKVKSSSNVLLPILSASYLIGYLLIANLSFPMERLSHTIFLSINIGLILSGNKLIPTDQVVRGGLLLVLACIGLFGSLRYTNAKKWSFFFHKKHSTATPLNTLQIGSFYQIDRASTPLIYYKGMESYALKNYDKASQQFKKSLALNPFHMHTLNNYATCMVELNHLDSAVSYYEKAYKTNSSLTEAKLNLVAVKHRQGKLEEAYNYLKKCSATPANERFSNSLRVLISSAVQNISKNNLTEKQKQLLNHIKNTQEVRLDLFELSKVRNATLEKEIQRFISVY